MAMSAGAEVGPLLTATSNANVRLSAGTLVLSLGITILCLPLMLKVLLPDVHFDVKHLLLKLFLTFIVAPCFSVSLSDPDGRSSPTLLKSPCI